MTFVHSPEDRLIPTELVARLEVAEAGSLELDIELMTLLGGARDIGGGVFYGPNEAVWHTSEAAETEGYWMLPSPSRSLDAALALAERVLPGMNCAGFDRDPRGADAYVSRNAVPREQIWLVEARAKTPALALCIAILKAVAADKPQSAEAGQ